MTPDPNVRDALEIKLWGISASASGRLAIVVLGVLTLTALILWWW